MRHMRAHHDSTRTGSILRSVKTCLLRIWLLAFCFFTPQHALLAQTPADLTVVLRSANGSSQFEVGEKIPLEVDFSSTSPSKYLGPCAMFFTSHFGFPQCRFFNGWKFLIEPEDGWVDLDKEFPSAGVYSGPTIEIKTPDLTNFVTSAPFELTAFFRFDRPGRYTVTVTTKVGLDNATNHYQTGVPGEKPGDTIAVAPQFTFEIVPATLARKERVVREGIAAFTAPMPPRTNPPSAAFQQAEEARNALCQLGTPEAAKALITLMAAGIYVDWRCVDHTSSPKEALAELHCQMLLPDAEVSETFFSTLTFLDQREETKTPQTTIDNGPYVARERDALFASLSRKNNKARLVSLATVLSHPPYSAPNPQQFGYPVPFPDPIIRAAAANFDSLPEQTQRSLLNDGWDSVRSPLMLDTIRDLAQKGNSEALLRWYELDRPGAEAFATGEVVRPVPRFSSHALLLPETSLPEPAQQQLAANFVKLQRWEDLSRAASLLHRYATAAVLPVVLPFVDANLESWPCSVSAPAAAYLLKVAPGQAASRVVRAIVPPGRNTCPDGPILTAIGKLQASPVLDNIAAAQVRGDTPAAQDALEEIRRVGSAGMKPLVWQGLVARKAVDAAEKTSAEANAAEIRRQQTGQPSLSDYIRAFTSAHGWIVTPADAAALTQLLGKDAVANVACTFACGASVSVGPGSQVFTISAFRSPRTNPFSDADDFLRDDGRLTFAINQYACRDLQSLEQKLLQLPSGSEFHFGWGFDERSADTVLAIASFLRAHGYRVKDAHNWSFLPSA